MILVAIYIFGVTALFLNFESLKVLGVLINFCFLPGFCLLTFRKKTIGFSDFLLSFSLSIGISSVLILFFLYLGLSVSNTYTILTGLIGAAVLTRALSQRVKKYSASIRLSRQELTFCTVALIMTALFSIPVLFGNDRISISFHGFLHSALISQIQSGIFPPENPALGGIRPLYPWGFHAFIAVLSAPVNIHPLKIISALNVISLLLMFCIVYSAAGFLGLSERYRYLVPLVMIGVMHSESGMSFILNAISGNVPSLHDLPELPHPKRYFQALAWGEKKLFISHDFRLLYLGKYYNATSMPLGIYFCLSYFNILMHLLNRNSSDKKIYIICIGIMIAGCIVIYLQLAIILLIHAPVWSSYILLSANGTLKEKFREASDILLPYIIAVLVLSPYFLYIAGGVSLSNGHSVRLDIYQQSYWNLIVFWPAFPIILYGVVIAIKHSARSRPLFFLLLSTLVCMCLSVFLRLQGNNSYKFSYILSFFFALFFVFGLSHWFPRIKNRWLKGSIGLCIILLLSFAPLLTEASYIISPWFSDTTYSLAGRHIEFAEDRERNMAYAWIRENTPLNSLILLPYTKASSSNAGANVIYSPAIFSERSLFVIRDDNYSKNHPDYSIRVTVWNDLFENPENPQVSRFFKLLNRSVYLLVEDDFHRLPASMEEIFPLTFQNDRQKVYLIYAQP